MRRCEPSAFLDLVLVLPREKLPSWSGRQYLSRRGQFPSHRAPPRRFLDVMRDMQRDLDTVSATWVQRFPNLEIAYLTCDGVRQFTGLGRTLPTACIRRPRLWTLRGQLLAIPQPRQRCRAVAVRSAITMIDTPERGLVCPHEGQPRYGLFSERSPSRSCGCASVSVSLRSS